MGAVYEAWQVQPHRRVAIKLLRYGLMSPTLLKRFELEVEILGRIEHPAITRLYEAGTVTLGGSRVPYFAMEFVEGVSIAAFAEQNQLSIEERVRLFQRVVDGVHVAHQKGVIHRDLKPANVLVDSEGQPKILDFGVARIEQADVQITVAPKDGGGLLGTLPYMSPEQVAGRFDEVDVRSDVYSLGIMAFELLCGRRPYRIEGRAWHEIACQIETQEPVRLGSIDKTLRGDLEAIVGKAIEKDRERRYASASALSDDLKRFLDCRPIEACPPSLGYQAAKFIRRHKVLVGMGGLVAIALALGLALATIGMVQARRSEQHAITESKRAQVNLQQAMNAVDRFMTVVAQGELKNIPEAALVRQKLLEDAVAFYEQFAGENQGDGGVQAGLDWALVRLAEIKDHIGDTLESRELLERNIETYSRRLETEPRHEESLRNLARGLDQQGLQRMAAGEHAQAVEAFQNAVETKSYLVDMRPNHIDYKREWARSLSELGSALGAMGDHSAAHDAFTASVRLLEELVQQDSTRPVFRRDLARVLENHATVWIRQGSQSQGLSLMQEAGTHYKRLVQQFSDDEEFLREYARYQGNWGDMLMRMGDATRALPVLEESNRVYRELAKRNPGDAMYGRDYAINCSIVGAVYSKMQRHDDARAAYERGIEAARRAVGQNPHRPDMKRDLARLLTENGKRLRNRGHHQAAMDSIHTAVDVLNEVVEHHPENLEYRLDMARTYEEWGCSSHAAGDIEKARLAFEQSYRLYTVLIQEGSTSPVVLAGMAYGLTNWGDVLEPDEARPKYREALGIWESLVQRYSNRRSYQKALEYTRRQLGRRTEFSREASQIQEQPAAALKRANAQDHVLLSPERQGSVQTHPDSDSAASQVFRRDARDRNGLLSLAGHMAVVTGRLDHVRLNVGNNQWSFLNFSRTRKEFYGAIHRLALPDLQSKYGVDLARLLGGTVELTGVLTVHKGAPSIVLTRASQLRLVSESAH